MSGNHAYVADWNGGLQIIDVRDPAQCVHVGGFSDIKTASAVAVAGNYAYVTDYATGLSVIDVSNPSNCVRVVNYRTGGFATGVALVGHRFFVADGNKGLLSLSSLPNIQQTLRIDATPNLPFTLEAATNLSDPNSWQPLLTTNVATMPFDFVDFDVKLTDKPQKFYRVRQP